MAGDVALEERLSFRVPKEVKELLAKKAAGRYMKLGAYIRMLCINHIKR